MSFVWAGYLITWTALAAYAWRLARREDETEDRLRAARERDRSAPGPA